MLLYSALASCISESLFDGETRCHLSSARIRIIKFCKYQVCNYGWILHTKRKGEWCGFLQLPLCISAGIKPFQWGDYWVKQEERVYFCQVGGSATTSEEGTGGFGWAVQLVAMAHTEGKNLHRLPKSQFSREFHSQGRRQPQQLLQSWRVSPLMHVAETLHPDRKTHLAF